MAKTIQQRKKEIYSSMSKEELVEEMIKRDGFDERKSFQVIARENIPEEAIKTIQKAIVQKAKDGSVVDKILIVEEYGVKRPTKLLEKMVENCLDKQFLKNLKPVCRHTLKSITRKFVKGLCTVYF